MAHIGHNYPVHFRRDFNLNVTNNSAGFAKGYNHGFAAASGTIGLALSTAPLVCIAQDETSFAGMKWTSDIVLRAGHPVKFECQTIEPPSFLDILIRGELTDVVLGSLGICTYGALNVFQYRTLNFRWDQLSLTHPSLFFVGASSITQFDAIRWPQWNNL